MCQQIQMKWLTIKIIETKIWELNIATNDRMISNDVFCCCWCFIQAVGFNSSFFSFNSIPHSMHTEPSVTLIITESIKRRLRANIHEPNECIFAWKSYVVRAVRFVMCRITLLCCAFFSVCFENVKTNKQTYYIYLNTCCVQNTQRHGHKTWTTKSHQHTYNKVAVE